MVLIQHRLPYAEGVVWLARLRDSQPTFDWPMLLESGQLATNGTDSAAPHHKEEHLLGARYDILVANPVYKFIHSAGATQILQAQTHYPHCVSGLNEASEEAPGQQPSAHPPRDAACAIDDPFTIIQSYLQPDRAITQWLSQAGLPFAGGAVGYFAYDLGREIERLPVIATNDTPVPALMVGLYDWAIVVDHHQQRCQLVSLCRHHTAAEIDALYQTLLQLASHHMDRAHAMQVAADRVHFASAISTDTADAHALLSSSAANAPPMTAQPFSPGDTTETVKKAGFTVTGPIRYNLDAARYAAAFHQVKAYIGAGDCYQINLAQRMQVPIEGSGLVAYQQFRQLSRAPFMAYLALQDRDGEPIEILSMSPERFLQVRDGVVETRPIKGTRPRHPDPIEDAAIAQSLAASEKDRAENVMIVDLLRNDIGKVCEIGSVRVTELFRLQRFTNVHHMVSIIQGKLKPTHSALDLLRACFPGGSITGAPKLRAMEIIESLEPHRRQVYCGSIGYIGFDGSMDTNIAIRTALITQSQMTFYAGGGVVADSDCAKEYQETLDKASQFIQLVQYFR